MEDLLDIAAGDAAAFGRWVATFELPLRQSLRIYAERVDAEAVVQEALLRAWQVAPRIQPDGKPNPLFRFTLRAARNLALNGMRRHAPRGVDLEELERLAPEETAVLPIPSDPFLRTALAECHERLPAQPKKALGARLGASGAQNDTSLAETVGMRLNTFLQNFTRARKLLLRCLEKRGIVLE